MNVELKTAWENLKKENPKLRIRDAAKILSVSEAELLATKIGDSVWLIKNDWAEFLKDTNSLGYVIALTRNEACVHERKGVYENISINGQMGLVVGPDIDLRIFLNHWKYGFYSEEIRENSILKSFQFFNTNGEAIHKIYSTTTSDDGGWIRMKEKYCDNNAQFITPVPQPVETPNENKDDSDDIPNFLQDWSKLEDTHDFFTLIKKYKFSRYFAVTAASDSFSFKIDTKKFLEIMTASSEKEMEIMIFVGNPNLIQIHTGQIKRLEPMGPWFNILDPNFNLHLRTDLIYDVWIVDKPTKDGLVTAIEVFDENKELILQMFGKRKPGLPQLKEWFELTRKFQTLPL
ncbi:ChuX/HutX family heme-like substrate-binding protein [Leptospira sp. 96542]|nr:ChuX/HutX family heme-like substrate-binding protein [Leptospira sp. 96542]